ncbi:MAG: heavy metal translocating P-type ATPase metal-binding domain-containing protein [Methylococcales bacterium]|nr:heavy metal translocating P-type ATPase metal-binding domain-containing protein [Methylococcales bacterium]
MTLWLIAANAGVIRRYYLERYIVEYCDYCGLEVKVTGFKMDYMDSKKIFCCEGCKAIYTLFGDAHVVKNTEHVASSVSH